MFAWIIIFIEEIIDFQLSEENSKTTCSIKQRCLLLIAVKGTTYDSDRILVATWKWGEQNSICRVVGSNLKHIFQWGSLIGIK